MNESIKKNPKHRLSALRKKLEPRKSFAWPRKETEMLLKAVEKYRNNWKAISNALKTKNAEQIRSKVGNIFKSIKSNPKHEHAKYAKILHEISLEG